MADLFRNRNFSNLWAAVFISGTGDVLYTVGIMVTIFQETGSALQTTGVLVATLLPIFLLSPIAGAVVDRYSRRGVMITADLVRTGLVALLLVISQTGELTLWQVYLIVAGLGAAAAFNTPARMAIIPALVSKEELVRANSLISGTLQATQALGYAIGGVLVVWVGFEALIIIDLITFLGSAALVGMIRLSPESRRRRQRRTKELPLYQSIKDGVHYLRHHDLARALVTMEWLEHIPHGVWTAALMLVFVEEALGAGTQGWGLQNAAFYVGVIFGALLATAVAGKIARWPGRIIITNAFLMSFITVIYAFSPNLAFALLLSLLFGPMFALRDVSQNSLLQAKVNEDMLGRVYALREMGWNVVFLSSGLLFAWLADFLPIRSIYLIAAVLYFLTALYALSVPALRTSRILEAPAPSGEKGPLAKEKKPVSS